jgi:uncharacterized membrane protein YgcG
VDLIQSASRRPLPLLHGHQTLGQAAAAAAVTTTATAATTASVAAGPLRIWLSFLVFSGAAWLQLRLVGSGGSGCGERFNVRAHRARLLHNIQLPAAAGCCARGRARDWSVVDGGGGS